MRNLPKSHDKMISRVLARRFQSTLTRVKETNWQRIPHATVLCIGDQGHGKTNLAHNLSNWSYDDISKQSHSPNFDKPSNRFVTTSTCWIEYEVETKNAKNGSKNENSSKPDSNRFHIAHLDTPGDFLASSLTPAFSAYDIVVWVVDAETGVTTTSHLDLAKQMSTHSDFENRVVVYLRNSENLDEETLELITSDLQDNLEELTLDSAKIVQTPESVSTEIAELLSKVDLKSGYRDDDLSFIPIERAFTVTNVGKVCVGILNGKLKFQPKVKMDLVGHDKIFPVEATSTGMFFKQMKLNEPGDRANCLIKGKTKGFEKIAKKGAVLVPEGKGQYYFSKNISFMPELDPGVGASKFTRVAAHTWSMPIDNLDPGNVEIQYKQFIREGDKMAFFSGTGDFHVAKVTKLG